MQLIMPIYRTDCFKLAKRPVFWASILYSREQYPDSHAMYAQINGEFCMQLLSACDGRLLPVLTRLFTQIIIMATAATSSSTAPSTDSLGTDVLAVPHQPTSFHFPKKTFGKTKVVERAFQS